MVGIIHTVRQLFLSDWGRGPGDISSRSVDLRGGLTSRILPLCFKGLHALPC